MPSLFFYISRLPEKNWNYYDGLRQSKIIRKPFVTENTSTQFMEQYFKTGGKLPVFTQLSLNNYGVNRADHTISIFFLGIIIHQKTILKEKTFYSDDVNHLYAFFPFIWFISCLAHDFAFYLETETEEFKKFPDTETFKKKLHIKHDLLLQKISHIPQDLFELCDAYFRYRHTSNKLDHGIYAGIALFDKLVENRIEKKQMRQTNLFWENALDKEYSYACATIALHNMWFPKEDKFSEYRLNGLGKMIGRSQITFDEAPLLFLLGIVDTIDPVKAYHEKTPEFVLKNVFLTFPDSKSFQIRISSKLNFETIEKKVRNLAGWLDTGISLSQRRIRILL
ncbi:MAG TPA: hypothetical protein VKR53_13920 [Puia sp.]|nr:hypothetical protein [Puia sp.]